MSSGNSIDSMVLSPDENSNASSTPSTSVPTTPSASAPSDLLPLISTPQSNYPSATAAVGPKGFRFHKTKKHLMNEWLNEKSDQHQQGTGGGGDPQKPLSIKTEPLEVDTSEEQVYVKCIPSPHATSFNHLRRSGSISGLNSSKGSGILGSSLGSAKKVGKHTHTHLRGAKQY